jgi:orotate phosphoribosyltransferase
MRTEEEMIKIFEDAGAIKFGHFVYTKGGHGSVYVNKRDLYPTQERSSTQNLEIMSRELAGRFFLENIDVVVGPAEGAIVLSEWTAKRLSELYGKRKVPGIYASKVEKEKGKFFLKPEFLSLVVGKRTLVVEDIINSGGSSDEVVNLLVSLGANVVGLGYLWNRGGIKASQYKHKFAFKGLVNKQYEVWGEEECPLCKQGVPVNTDVGKGREFLEKQKQK